MNFLTWTNYFSLSIFWTWLHLELDPRLDWEKSNLQENFTKHEWMHFIMDSVYEEIGLRGKGVKGKLSFPSQLSSLLLTGKSYLTLVSLSLSLRLKTEGEHSIAGICSWSVLVISHIFMIESPNKIFQVFCNLQRMKTTHGQLITWVINTLISTLIITLIITLIKTRKKVAFLECVLHKLKPVCSQLVSRMNFSEISTEFPTREISIINN